nr:12840_t:CDS:2 [Entrophospora candida]
MTLISYIVGDLDDLIKKYYGWLSKSERDSQNNNDTSSGLKSHSENHKALYESSFIPLLYTENAAFIDDSLPVCNDDTSIELKAHTKNNSIEEIIQ